MIWSDHRNYILFRRRMMPYAANMSGRSKILLHLYRSFCPGAIFGRGYAWIARARIPVSAPPEENSFTRLIIKSRLPDLPRYASCTNRVEGMTTTSPLVFWLFAYAMSCFIPTSVGFFSVVGFRSAMSVVVQDWAVERTTSVCCIPDFF